MSDLNFNPMPYRHHRGLVRWLLLAANAIPFALLVIAYPWLIENGVRILQSNLAHLLLPAWAVVIVLHLVIAVLLEVREMIIHARIERERRREYQKAQTMNRVRPGVRAAE